MADVHPFRALRYDSNVVGELDNIVSPPFDTIPAELQRSLYQRSTYNVVRLEAGERRPTDTPEDNRYTRAAALMERWSREGALVRDSEPAYYLVRHSFSLQGRQVERHELIAAVHLEDYDRRVVLPHEYTRDEDKRDRLALMTACRTNFSPIMSLYSDEGNGVGAVLARVMESPPMASFSDPGRQGYAMWRIAGPDEISAIRRALESVPLYIADGHHRYETALNYRGGPGAGTPDAASGFVMMGLIEFSDPGLLVLPYHRVVGGLDAGTLERVKARLGETFDSRPYAPAGDDRTAEFQAEVERLGANGLAMGLLEPGAAGYSILTLRDSVDTDGWGLLGGSEAWVLEDLILKPILEESLESRLSYVHDGDEVVDRVGSGEAQLGFFLKPFPLDLFKAIMDRAERLPSKSTFFYPKLPTGIVMNPLEGTI